MPESSNDPESHMVFVSQLVQDVKLGGGNMHGKLAEEVGRLRAGLLKRAYIPGEKLNAVFEALEITSAGELNLDIYGGMLQGSDLQSGLDVHIRHKFPLEWRTAIGQIGDIRTKKIEEVLLEHCKDVSVDDGGNTQNMAINTMLAMTSEPFRNRIKMTIFSSSDPFKRLPESIRDKAQELTDQGLIQYEQLEGLGDRLAIQTPCLNESGQLGSFALTTSPVSTAPMLRSMLEERQEIRNIFESGTYFIASDPIFDEVARYASAKRRYGQLNNASTAFRSLVANMAYQKVVTLPMNSKEAADVAKVFEQRGADREMHEIKRPPFPSPLEANGIDVDRDALVQLDHALWKLRLFNPPQPGFGNIAYNYPITFGSEGGMVVGTAERKAVACFTSILSPEGEQKLIKEYGDEKYIMWDKIREIGAGDSAASVAALFNSFDPLEFVGKYMEGREETNAALLHYARTIFVSTMGRIVGNFLVRTGQTHWSSINLEKFPQLLDEVGKESLILARQLVKSDGSEYGNGTINKWGVTTVTWNQGRLAIPDTEEG